MKPRRPKLRTPGPVEVPGEFVDAARAVLHHRSDGFRRQFGEVRRRLRALFRTEGEVAVLAASGSGAMEAAVANLVSAGDGVVVVQSGKYGERWAELSETYGANVARVEIQPGGSVDPGDLARRVEDLEPRAVFVVHSETSTGALNDVEAIARRVGGQTLVVVDAISSLGVHPLEMDQWGVAVAVGASQKALGLPPGMAFVAIGPRAVPRVERAGSPRYYFDLRKYSAAAAKDQTPFTAPVTGIAALLAALRRIEPLDGNIARHARLAAAARAGMGGLGLEPFAEVPSNAVTVVRVPEGLDAEGVVNVLEEEFGLRIAHGQGTLRGRVLRVGHLGWLSEKDLLQLFEALEGALQRCGHGVKRGGAVRAVREALESGGGS